MAGIFSPLVVIEDQFNQTSAANFMKEVWHYSFYLSALYVVTIFGIQKLMEKRPKYHLRGLLMAWSLMLAVFSFIGFYTAGVHHLGYLLEHGWKGSVCDPVLVYKHVGLWSFLFILSKCPELVDTYFIVLRKQKLIFLHWYHHITVFIYCWFSYSHITNAQQWFITMNYFVHAIMYFYYAIRASSIYRPPVWVNMVITSLQLVQMVIGVWVNIYVFYNMTYTPDWYCDGIIETTYLYVGVAFVMYASYFLLFAHFFYSAYFQKKSSAANRVSAQQTITASPGSVVVGNGVVADHNTTTNNSTNNTTSYSSNFHVHGKLQSHAGKNGLLRNGLRHRD